MANRSQPTEWNANAGGDQAELHWQPPIGQNQYVSACGFQNEKTHCHANEMRCGTGLLLMTSLGKVREVKHRRQKRGRQIDVIRTAEKRSVFRAKTWPSTTCLSRRLRLRIQNQARSLRSAIVLRGSLPSPIGECKNQTLSVFRSWLTIFHC